MKNYHEMYEKIENPLNDDEVVRKLIEGYSDELRTKQYYNKLVQVNYKEKKYKGINMDDKDRLVSQIFNEWKNDITKNHNSKIHPKILDIGVGSGIIGITAALEIKDSYVLGVDISEKALDTAEKNKELLKVSNIKFLKSNLFENVEFKQFDMIVSNPPYISLNEAGIMSDDTLLHEPSEALFAENDGLYFYYEICQKALDYLADFGYLLFEIGYKQGKNVAEIMTSSGFKNVEVIKDLAGLDRVVVGQKL